MSENRTGGFFRLTLYVSSVLWYCWFGLLTCKNRLPYNLYCVGGDVKHYSVQSNPLETFMSLWGLLNPVAPCMRWVNEICTIIHYLAHKMPLNRFYFDYCRMCTFFVNVGVFCCSDCNLLCFVSISDWLSTDWLDRSPVTYPTVCCISC